MKIFQKRDSHLFCGHWNGSPLEIGVSAVLKAVLKREVYHYHEYYEYYVVLHGKGSLIIEGETVPLEANKVIMIEPKEKHMVSWVDSEGGAQWVIIKEKSISDSKIVV